MFENRIRIGRVLRLMYVYRFIFCSLINVGIEFLYFSSIILESNVGTRINKVLLSIQLQYTVKEKEEENLVSFRVLTLYKNKKMNLSSSDISGATRRASVDRFSGRIFCEQQIVFQYLDTSFFLRKEERILFIREAASLKFLGRQNIICATECCKQ